MKSLSTLIIVLLFAQSFANTDKYRLILRNDPASTATIAWNQISGSNARVYYGKVDYGTDYTKYTRWADVDRSTSYRGMENRFVRLANLDANTAYYFVLVDDDGPSRRFWFKTAPKDKSRLSFIAGGDSRNNRTPRQNANKLVPKLKPHAVLFGGDMTSGDTSTEWKNWMDDWQLTIANDGRMFPIVAARGNHENASVIERLFDSPNQDVYFALTFGDNLYRFYTLNTLISVGGNQKTWLENDLKQNSQAAWKSAQYHYPMRAHTSGKFEQIFVYNAWADIFYENKVRLVVECDSHMVKTTYPVKPSSGYSVNDGFVRDNVSGTVYTGEGCWGAPLRPNDDNKAWTQSSGRFNQFKLIFVDEDKIELRTIKIDNADQVGENTNNDIFSLPQNLQVWQMDDPKQTSVVYIYRDIDAQFAPTMPNIYNNTSVDIDIQFNSSTDHIKNITYKAKNINDGSIITLGTSTNASNTFSATFPSSGNYLIMAEITRLDDISTTIEKEIFVGDFSLEGSNPLMLGSNDFIEDQDGDMALKGNFLYLGHRTFSNFSTIGLRFDNLDIPQHATIDYAYILFTPSESNSTLAEGLIKIEDSSNSDPFKGVNEELRNRTKATEELIWQVPAWTANQIGDETKTPDLKKLVQNIVDKNGWREGNALTFSIQPINLSLTQMNANRVAYAHERDASKAPKLVYGYTYKSSQWTAVATVTSGIGINTETPATPLDINGLMRSSVRNNQGQLFICDEAIEGAIGYDDVEKNIKVCSEENGVLVWRIISL